MKITQGQAKVIIDIHQEALKVAQLNDELMTSTGLTGGYFRIWVWPRCDAKASFIHEDIYVGDALFSDELNKALSLLRRFRRELEVI